MPARKLRRFFSLVVLSCAIATVIFILVFPRGLVALIHTMQVASAGAWGSVYHLRELATAQDRQVAKPNRDTIYSSVAIDLATGPVLLTVPPYERYWNVQFIDANSNVFGYMGSRHGNGDKDRTALLVPQDYQQDTGDQRIIRATSDKVWLVYRFHVVDANDIAAAVQVQNNLELTTSQASPGR